MSIFICFNIFVSTDLSAVQQISQKEYSVACIQGRKSFYVLKLLFQSSKTSNLKSKYRCFIHYLTNFITCICILQTILKLTAMLNVIKLLSSILRLVFPSFILIQVYVLNIGIFSLCHPWYPKYNGGKKKSNMHGEF